MAKDKIPQSYEERYNAARETGNTEQITYPFYIWEVEGQKLIGELVSIEKVKSEQYDGDFYRYIFDTDFGMTAVIAGKVVDDVLSDGSHKGDLIAITFRGKQVTKAGQTYNMFDVEIVN